MHCVVMYIAMSKKLKLPRIWFSSFLFHITDRPSSRALRGQTVNRQELESLPSQAQVELQLQERTGPGTDLLLSTYQDNPQLGRCISRKYLGPNFHEQTILREDPRQLLLMYH